MNYYIQKVRENVLPLSVGNSLPQVFTEWFFTELVLDYEQRNEICQLCNQEELRYHFQIKNRYTNYILWVGSQCILKFNVPVYENGLLLSKQKAKRKLKLLIEKKHIEFCIKSLEKLASSTNNKILHHALDYYMREKSLTPKFAFVVFWQLQTHKIDYNPTFFKINLKKKRYKDNFQDMPLERVHIIWPALSSSQRNTAIEMGHSTPHSEINE